MSQYSALMVMEKMYGKEKMRKFLQYEADRYLGGRGSEEIKEQPLMYNENQQYIHYRKGSVIMYALRDYIGEDTLNAALKRYVAKVAYQEPPYTTSREFVKFIAEAVPDSLSYLVGDFFEKITLYDNRMTEATAEKLPNGDYKVKCKISVSKFYADSVGNQSLAENLADYIDVGVLSETEENGKKTDKVLDIRRVKFTKKDNELEFIVKEKPLKAAIDPNRLLLDRVPEDNFKKLN
jgi:aminopeptidase N